MAGLLDIFNSPEGRLGLGLLSAGMPSNIPMGQRLGQVMQQQDQFAQAQQQAKQAEMQQKLMQSQMEDRNAQTQMRQAQMAAEQRKQQALPDLFAGGQPEGSGMPQGSMQGAMQGAQQDPQSQQGSMQPGSLNWRRALSAGYSPDEIQKLAGLQNIGRQKVARTVKGMGPDGREYEYQVDEFGQRVGDGVAQFRAPIMQDLGGKVVALDPYTLQQQQALSKSMTPDGAANFGLARQRLSMDQQKAAFEQQQGGKPSFNADAGGFIYPPSQNNPQGAVVPLQGFQKPLNDVQAKAQLFGTRMREADKVLGDLSKDGKNFSTPGANAPFGIGGLVNTINTEQGQMLDQAKRDFTNAVLRRESGAAIAPSEFASADKQYFPQIGDSAKVIEQKARARALAINGILAEVPKGTPPISTANPAQGQKTVVKTGMYGGKKVVQYSDGSVDYAN